jgi:threonine dehydrogenase-like Zn-dependent dehydrogenase
MKAKAVRLHGENDLRLDEIELPTIGSDEILARVISDSICMSSYKATIQGSRHKRVPDDIGEKPVIIGHELSGEIVEVGEKWKGSFKPGQRFSIQPALNYPENMNGMGAPGYSYQYIGGDATHVIIPNEVMDLGCLLAYDGPAFYLASLAEPVSCIVGTFHAQYHTEKYKYVHTMGIVPDGKMAILAGAGPMGMGAVDYAIHNPDARPSLLVVTDIDQARLDRTASIYTVDDAKKNGVDLRYVNTAEFDDPVAALREITGGDGYDDAMVFAPVPALFEQADAILGFDGCLNFFAGPTDPATSAKINLYDIHYASHHVVGTSGGSTEDMIESLDLMGKGLLNPSAMITHVGGLNAVVETTKTLPKIPGGKKLMYTNVEMELTAIADFAEKGKSDPFFAALAEIAERHGGLWSPEAESYLLENAKPIM